MIPPLAHIDWDSFLARPLLPSPSPEAVAALTCELVLIAEAGSGSAFAHLPGATGTRLVLLESTETDLFDLHSTPLNPPLRTFRRGAAMSYE